MSDLPVRQDIVRCSADCPGAKPPGNVCSDHATNGTRRQDINILQQDRFRLTNRATKGGRELLRSSYVDVSHNNSCTARDETASNSRTDCSAALNRDRHA